MRYTREKGLNTKKYPIYAKPYKCNHPLYNACTLYSLGPIGLAVVQQRFDPKSKMYRWTAIDADLADDIYKEKGFKAYFEKNAKKPVLGLYPTVAVRQIMWALRMKPLPKEIWEKEMF